MTSLKINGAKTRQRSSSDGRKSLETLAVSFFVVLQIVIFAYFQLSLDNHGHFASTAMLGGMSLDVPNVLDDPSVSIPEGEPTTVGNDAMSYVRSFKSFERKLNFFHIPKTAGTAVEQIAAENGIPWGSCLFKHKPKRKVCPHPSGEEWPKNVGWWHIPSQFFPLVNSDPYQGSEMFGVVRDPFDRMVSEFYYTCTLKVKDWRPNQCDRARLEDNSYMNSWLARKLEYGQDSLALEYLTDNSHFTPHYEFVVGPHDVRMLDYVLRLDDRDAFHEDFQRLMKAFKLPLNLRKMQSISSHGDGHHNSSLLTAQQLTSESTYWIRKKYANDIERLGYNRTGK